MASDARLLSAPPPSTAWRRVATNLTRCPEGQGSPLWTNRCLRGGRRRCGGRFAELPLDPGELLLGALPDRAFEPVAGREDVPPPEQQESADHRQRGVVEQQPVEVRLERNAALV